MHPDGQERILHDSRFSRPPIVAANGDALRALRVYNLDPRRDPAVLYRVKEALRQRSVQHDIRPKSRDEAIRCIEAIEMFERNENALAMRGLALREATKSEPLIIEGVSVSIRPDFIVDGGKGRVGAGLVRVAKAPDPADCKRDETKRQRGEHRREMGRYLVALLQLLLDAQGGSLGIVERSLCFVADVRLGERIGPAQDHAARVRAIRAACRQIAQLWPGVTPRASILRKGAA